jgi:hypothetical protein
MTWLKAGDAEQARRHAQACLTIIAANDGPALERFFGFEALALAEHSAGNSMSLADAVAAARSTFEQIGADDRGWCAATLEKLNALATN